MTPPSTLTRPDGATIAYRRTLGHGPGVVFLGGYRSDMTGSKATSLEAQARARGRACVCFDHFGHGASSGALADGTIGRWREDAVAVLDALTQGPQILVGSSLGGWLALLTALARPERVAALVLVAPAPDFTEELIWNRLDADQRARLQRDRAFEEPSDYSPEPDRISLDMIEEARAHLLLGAPIALSMPVRIFHGTADDVVPWQLSVRLIERLTGSDALLTLVKSGDHRLSAPADLDRLNQTVEALAGSPPAPSDSPDR